MRTCLFGRGTWGCGVSYLCCIAERGEGLCFIDIETDQNEEYFTSNLNEWNLLSFLRWRKEQGLELRGKGAEHNIYVKQLLKISTREAKQALELFKV